MINEPQLGNMTADDLGQRYNNSFMHYNGKFVEVLGFADRTTFTTREKRNLPFDWKLVNIARPPSRWYQFDYEGTLFLGYLAYKNARQFVRGITTRNTQFFEPVRGYVIDQIIMDQINKTWQANESVLKPKVDDLEWSIAKYKHALLSKQMAIIGTTLYYRTVPIGHYIKKHIHLDNSNFSQEVIDLGLGSLISYEPVKKNEELPLKKGWTLNLTTNQMMDINWDAQAALMRRMEEQVFGARRNVQVNLEERPPEPAIEPVGDWEPQLDADDGIEREDNNF